MKTIILMLLLLSSMVSAEETSLKVCYSTFYPYSYTDKEKSTGFSISLYREALKRANISVSFVELPWARCLSDFNLGNYDAVGDGIRIENSLYSQKKLVPLVEVLWVQDKSHHIKFVEMAQFSDEISSQVRGYGYTEVFTNYSGFRKRIIINSDLQGLKMLAEQRVNLFISDLLNGSQLIKLHQLAVRPLLPPVNVSFHSLAFSELKKEEFERFELALETMFEDGTIDVYYLKYLGMTHQEFSDLYGV